MKFDIMDCQCNCELNEIQYIIILETTENWTVIWMDIAWSLASFVVSEGGYCSVAYRQNFNRKFKFNVYLLDLD